MIQPNEFKHIQLQGQNSQSIDLFVYQPPTQQQYQYKIYINDCDSYVGNQLVEQFRNDHLIQANPNLILGSSIVNKETLQNDKNNQLVTPSGVNQIIDTKNQRLYNSVLIDADIILFTLTRQNIQEFEYILKLLKNCSLQKEKRLICVSSFISWGKKRGVSSHVHVKKQEIHLRNTIDYHVKVLEDMCLAISNENQKVKGSVVFSGLAYGSGQDSFFGYFKRALQQQKALQIYGKGTNLLTTIHLKDLTQMIHNIAFLPYQHKKNWHFAVDLSKTTQKQLLKCIAQNLGNGAIQQKPIEQCFMRENFDLFTLDLQVHDAQQLTQWHSKQGLIKNIELIVGEFNLFRGLRPNKIVVMGPPVSGKSTVSQVLSKSYGLPIISLRSLVEDVKRDETEFGHEIRALLDQIKVHKVEEERKAYEDMKKKKKGKGVEQFNPDKIVPRLPQEQLKKVIKWRLNFSDCLNKGYILDSVIKTYNVAEGVFVNQEGVIDNQIFPNSVFSIKSTDDQIKERLKTLPAQKIQNTHWTQEQTTRRLQAYVKQNQQKSMKSFFQNKVDIKEVQMNYPDPAIFMQFVQRNGPLGFKKQAQQPTAKEGQPQAVEQNGQKGSDNEGQEDEEDMQEQRQFDQEFNLQNLTEKQQKILNQKSRPIRQYLIDNVIPEITQGLLQICKQVPEDPIQFLIGFLEKKNIKKNK